MTIYTHKHHIVPVHAGGGNEPSNLIRITVEQHAQEHWELFCVHGRWEDELAWRVLSGQINTYEADQEARRQAQHARWAVPGAREEQSRLMTGEGNPMWGKKLTDVQKAAISKANSVPKPHVSINMKKLHAEGKSYTFSKEDCGARRVVAEGVTYESLTAATLEYGFKNHNAMAYRINSDKPKWSEFYYA